MFTRISDSRNNGGRSSHSSSGSSSSRFSRNNSRNTSRNTRRNNNRNSLIDDHKDDQNNAEDASTSQHHPQHHEQERSKRGQDALMARRIYGHCPQGNSSSMKDKGSQDWRNSFSSYSSSSSSDDTGTATSTASATSTAIWNTLAVFLVLFTLLFVTDFIQLGGTISGSSIGKNSNSSSMSPKTRLKMTILANQASDVVTKDDSNSTQSSSLTSSSAGLPLQWFQYVPRGRDVAMARTRMAINNTETISDNYSDDKSSWGSWPFDIPPRKRPTQSSSSQSTDSTSNSSASSDIDPYALYPHRDVPLDEILSSSMSTDWWQLDPQYLSKFVPASLQLVQRAQKAIMAEYGYDYDEDRTNNDIDDVMTNSHTKSTTQMFDLKFYESLHDVKSSTLEKVNNDNGGWTTKSSWRGLKRRLLHAIMTEDSFVFAMGGHSAAAGHGNHFQQSYSLQVQWILEPIFARLGIQHEARNFGNGGLGTAHNSIAAQSIYGPDVDMIMWDSSMTEKEEKARDLFHRQALMGGRHGGSNNNNNNTLLPTNSLNSQPPQFKIPILWTESVSVAKFWNDEAGVDVGCKGSGKSGIPKGRSWDDIQSNITYAARYMKCSDDLSKMCKEYEYDGVCWIDRPDHFQPPSKQNPVPGGRASWHPGFRSHQLGGRIIAYTILQALKEVLVDWNNRRDNNYRIPDGDWHLTNYYDEMRGRIDQVMDDPDENQGKCHEYGKAGIERICSLPMNGRTEFTPRAFPSETSIRSLMSPSMMQYIDPAQPNVYDPPDVFNPSLYPPEDAIDVVSIVEAGPPFEKVIQPDYHSTFYAKPSFATPGHVPVGKGVSLVTAAGDDRCDGSLHSFCNRGKDQTCLLSGHNDGRNGLKFDSYSGWLVMNLPNVKNGVILVKIQSWHQPKEAYRTKGWSSINNEGKEGDDGDKEEDELSERRQLLRSERLNKSSNVVANYHNQTTTTELLTLNTRSLKSKKSPKLCSEFRFEYSIDGSITSYNKTEFEDLRKTGKIQRVVEIYKLLDDPQYRKSWSIIDNDDAIGQEVEVAIRIVGCGRGLTFNLNHIYWS